jgi:aminoglycoside phosphotransferase (APT) family kinase protein
MSDSTNASANTPASMGDRLGSWLSEVRGRPVTVHGLEAVSAGARRFNALCEVRDAATGDSQVALTMIPSASIQLLDVATEAAVRTVAQQAGVLVPAVYEVCTDESVLGGPFFLSAAIMGETVPRRVLRLVNSSDPSGGLGQKIAGQIGTAIAQLHAIAPDHIPDGLIAPPGAGPIDAAMTGVENQLNELLAPSPIFSFGVSWLERNAPSEPDVACLVHSDIRNGNIIVGPDGLRAILDWEGSRIGDPMEDTAWTCQRMWRFREDHRAVGGLGDAATLREAYIAAGGHWDEDRFRWWRVMGTVRWGLSMAGQSRAHLDGSFPSIVMAASGRRVAELEYDALCLLRP